MSLCLFKFELSLIDVVLFAAIKPTSPLGSAIEPPTGRAEIESFIVTPPFPGELFHFSDAFNVILRLRVERVWNSGDRSAMNPVSGVCPHSILELKSYD